MTAAMWGLVEAMALIIGALLTFWLKSSQRFVGLILAFGAGILISAASAALGYGLTSLFSLQGALVQAFAAGVLLVLVADTMLPEAHTEGGKAAGLLTVLGFAVAFALS